MNLQIGFTAGLLALAVSLHQCKPQETGNYLSVGRDGACQISSSIHLFERQARGMENEERGKRSSLELRSEFGSGGSANQWIQNAKQADGAKEGEGERDG